MSCTYPVDATITNVAAGYLSTAYSPAWRYSPMGGSKITSEITSINTSIPLVISPEGTTFYGSPWIRMYANSSAYSQWYFSSDGSWLGSDPNMINGGGITRYSSNSMTAAWNANPSSSGTVQIQLTGLQSSPAASLCLTAPPVYGTSVVPGAVTVQSDVVYGATAIGTDYNYAINNYRWSNNIIPITFSYTYSAKINSMFFSPSTISYTVAVGTPYQATTNLIISGDYPGTLNVSWEATTSSGFTVTSVLVNGNPVSSSGDIITVSGVSGVQTTNTPVVINLPGMSVPGTYITNLNFKVTLP
ncbi:hypothetical protein [Edwardsiella tarda]|uniref:hypothetical protein n=1 Tax=Edwardsiella tarda TaxID=636 RepID=UPI003D2ED418